MVISDVWSIVVHKTRVISWFNTYPRTEGPLNRETVCDRCHPKFCFAPQVSSRLWTERHLHLEYLAALV